MAANREYTARWSLIRCRHAESVESAMNTGAAERNRYVHSGRKSPKQVPRRSDNYNHFASSLRF